MTMEQASTKDCPWAWNLRSCKRRLAIEAIKHRRPNGPLHGLFPWTGQFCSITSWGEAVLPPLHGIRKWLSHWYTRPPRPLLCPRAAQVLQVLPNCCYPKAPCRGRMFNWGVEEPAFFSADWVRSSLWLNPAGKVQQGRNDADKKDHPLFLPELSPQGRACTVRDQGSMCQWWFSLPLWFHPDTLLFDPGCFYTWAANESHRPGG